MPVQRWSDRIWVAKLTHDPAFTEELDGLIDEVQAGQPRPDVVIDLSGVESINSNNLTHLLQLRKLIISADTRLRIAAPPNPVWAVFLLTGLDKVFDFAPDTGTALADLQLGS